MRRRNHRIPLGGCKQCIHGLRLCVAENSDDDSVVLNKQINKQYSFLSHFAGVHRARAISHFEEGLGIVQGLDERYVQCEFKTSGRLLPMLERLVRRVFVSRTKGKHHRTQQHKDSFFFIRFYIIMCSAFIYKLL